MNKTPLQKTFNECRTMGDFMKYARQSRGISLMKLEYLSGLSAPQIGKRENGSKVRTRLSSALLAADALGISVQEYVTGIPAPQVKTGSPRRETMKKHRLQRGISRAELAKAIGISERSMQTIEISKHSPYLDSVMAAAEYLGISVDEYVGHAWGAENAHNGKNLQM